MFLFGDAALHQFLYLICSYTQNTHIEHFVNIEHLGGVVDLA